MAQRIFGQIIKFDSEQTGYDVEVYKHPNGTDGLRLWFPNGHMLSVIHGHGTYCGFGTVEVAFFHAEDKDLSVLKPWFVPINNSDSRNIGDVASYVSPKKLLEIIAAVAALNPTREEA